MTKKPKREKAQIILNRAKTPKKNSTCHEERPFYYLHGAFHLYYKPLENSPSIYWKIETGIPKLKIYQDRLSKSIKCIQKKLLNIKIDQKGCEETRVLDKIECPLLIFEDRSDIKKAIIMKDDYLRGCYLALQEVTGHIFVFGCSFERDTHILEALFHPPYKKLYIAYREGDIKTKQNVKNFLSNRLSQSTWYPIACNDICWVRVQPSEEHLLWTAFHTT